MTLFVYLFHGNFNDFSFQILHSFASYLCIRFGWRVSASFPCKHLDLSITQQ